MKRLLIVLCCSLSACQSPDDDLMAFIDETEHLPTGKLEPLPQVVPFQPKLYNADHLLMDPFMPRKASVNHANQPNLNRPREPLEAYPLESLRFVGVMSRNKLVTATLQTPDNLVYQVKVGNYAGDKLGLITAIAQQPGSMKYELTLRETVQDPDSGEWTVQTRTLELQDKE